MKNEAKVCIKCKKEKLVTKFSKNRNSVDGFHNWCKKCCKEYKRKYDRTHKKERSEYGKKYYQKHRDRICKWNSEWQKSLNGRYIVYRKTAKRRKLEFDLSVEAFEEITLQLCYYCGKYTKNEKYCGIDRVDNSKGYVLDNCVPCCRVCNSIKSTLTMEEFLDSVRNIYKHCEEAGL